MKRGIPYYLLAIAAFAFGCGDDKSDSDGTNGGGDTGGDTMGTGDTSSAEDNCEKLCATEDSLNCPEADPVDCREDCNEFIEEAPASCQAEAEAYLACMAAATASDWECNDEGDADPKSDVCTTESDAYGACEESS